VNDQTLMLRQIHPTFLREGEVSSQAFFPFPKDAGKLSVYDGDQISPADAYRHYTMGLRLASVGIWAVSGGEVSLTGLEYRSDPIDGNPAHAVIDFGARSDSACRKLAKRLRNHAIARGRLSVEG
jgi:hypothetical protein